MKDFKDFELINTEIIFGGELEPTYVAANGDYYDAANHRYIIIS